MELFRLNFQIPAVEHKLWNQDIELFHMSGSSGTQKNSEYIKNTNKKSFRRHQYPTNIFARCLKCCGVYDTNIHTTG